MEDDEREEREEATDRELAGVKLVEAVVNTPKDKMSRMTVLTKVQAYACTMLVVYEKVAEHLKCVINAGEKGAVNIEIESISETFRHSLYEHNLSIQGKLRDQVNELTLEQIGMEAEEEGSTFDQS